jgi:hypothetical protein
MVLSTAIGKGASGISRRLQGEEFLLPRLVAFDLQVHGSAALGDEVVEVDAGLVADSVDVDQLIDVEVEAGEVDEVFVNFINPFLIIPNDKAPVILSLDKVFGVADI